MVTELDADDRVLAVPTGFITTTAYFDYGGQSLLAMRLISRIPHLTTAQI